MLYKKKRILLIKIRPRGLSELNFIYYFLHILREPVLSVDFDDRLVHIEIKWVYGIIHIWYTHFFGNLCLNNLHIPTHVPTFYLKPAIY